MRVSVERVGEMSTLSRETLPAAATGSILSLPNTRGLVTPWEELPIEAGPIGIGAFSSSHSDQLKLPASATDTGDRQGTGGERGDAPAGDAAVGCPKSVASVCRRQRRMAMPMLPEVSAVPSRDSNSRGLLAPPKDALTPIVPYSRS